MERLEQPKLAIAIVNWNTRDLLERCLNSIYATLDSMSVEVWVADNASRDGSLAMLANRFPTVQVIANASNLGFARANNQIIGRSGTPYVLLLNSDTIVLPGSLATMVRFLDAHPDVAVVGCRLLNADGSFQAGGARFPTLWSELLHHTGLAALWRGKGRNHPGYRDSRSAADVDWVGGACMLIRRAAIEGVGPLDEGYFMYSEEMDFCFRAKRRGWRIAYLPDAEIVHLGGQSAKTVRAQMLAALHRSKMRFFEKHCGAWQAALLRLIIVASLLGKCAWWLLVAVLRLGSHRKSLGEIMAYASTVPATWRAGVEAPLRCPECSQ